MYHYGNQVILSYTVGTAEILEMPGSNRLRPEDSRFTRTLNVGPSPRDLLMRVAPTGFGVALVRRLAGDVPRLEEKDGSRRSASRPPRLRLP